MKHPTSRGQKYGSLYRVVAEAKVVHRHDDYLSAVIRQSGRKSPAVTWSAADAPVTIEIEVQAPDGEPDGTIVERVETRPTCSVRRDCLHRPWTRRWCARWRLFHVVEQRDPYYDITKEDEDLPYSVIGRIVIVRVDEYSATAIVSMPTAA